ncbi:MAG: helix-turn-helix transcriptional regulator [Anaerorhabdus sp.]|uniref:helix-turn-helix domain-containing protein n=1 Tax=Anaerorhabdus sp. TaxID=1872524 RepID=UPI002FCAA744
MNIEIANRLVDLRKQHGYSQEELAQELGISRQAISKWERAESSPDTDNLILLAKLYNISLDEMLKATSETNTEEKTQEQATDDTTNSNKRKGKVHVGWDGIHVNDGDDIVDISWDGIHVVSKEKDEFHLGRKGMRAKSSDNETIDADNDGVYINGKKVEREDWWNEEWSDDDYSYKRHPRTVFDYIPYGVIAFLGFLYLGIFESMWHPAWILLCTIPIYTSFAKAIRKRNPYCFNYSMLAFTIFIYVGFVYGAWHPGWVVFITIPVYYYLVHFFKNLFKRNKKDAWVDVEYATKNKDDSGINVVYDLDDEDDDDDDDEK